MSKLYLSNSVKGEFSFIVMQCMHIVNCQKLFQVIISSFKVLCMHRKTLELHTSSSCVQIFYISE
jgi:hypothetical protein